MSCCTCCNFENAEDSRSLNKEELIKSFESIVSSSLPSQFSQNTTECIGLNSAEILSLMGSAQDLGESPFVNKMSGRGGGGFENQSDTYYKLAKKLFTSCGNFFPQSSTIQWVDWSENTIRAVAHHAKSRHDYSEKIFSQHIRDHLSLDQNSLSKWVVENATVLAIHDLSKSRFKKLYVPESLRGVRRAYIGVPIVHKDHDSNVLRCFGVISFEFNIPISQWVADQCVIAMRFAAHYAGVAISDSQKMASLNFRANQQREIIQSIPGVVKHAPHHPQRLDDLAKRVSTLFSAMAVAIWSKSSFDEKFVLEGKYIHPGTDGEMKTPRYDGWSKRIVEDCACILIGESGENESYTVWSWDESGKVWLRQSGGNVGLNNPAQHDRWELGVPLVRFHERVEHPQMADACGVLWFWIDAREHPKAPGRKFMQGIYTFVDLASTVVSVKEIQIKSLIHHHSKISGVIHDHLSHDMADRWLEHLNRSIEDYRVKTGEDRPFSEWSKCIQIIKGYIGVVTSVMNLVGVNSEIMEYSGSERERPLLEPCSLQGLCEDACDMFNILHVSEPIAVNKSRDISVLCNRRLVTFSILNILQNSWKNSGGHRQPIEIRSIDCRDGQVRVEIADSGAGFSDSAIDLYKSEKPGSTPDDPDRRTKKGLYIAREFIRMSSGRMGESPLPNPDSQGGPGAIVYFFLPLYEGVV